MPKKHVYINKKITSTASVPTKSRIKTNLEVHCYICTIHGACICHFWKSYIFIELFLKKPIDLVIFLVQCRQDEESVKLKHGSKTKNLY